jgi:hypothetical protein
MDLINKKKEGEKDRNLRRQIDDKKRSNDHLTSRCNLSQAHQTPSKQDNTSHSKNQYESTPKVLLNMNMISSVMSDQSRRNSLTNGNINLNLRQTYREFKNIMTTTLNTGDKHPGLVTAPQTRREYIISIKDDFSPVVADL